MNPDPRIDQLLEGRLDEAEWESLQAELKENPELREQFVERKWLHSRLLTDRDMLAELASAPAPASRRGGAATWSGWAAAAVVALLGALAFSTTRPEPAAPAVATLIEAENCRWEGSELPTAQGARLGPGLLALAEGMATIRFDSGATVTLEAPTRLQVDSAMRCRLVDGSVVADVPDSAHGFTIDTEKVEVIDLGTRFGVTSTPLGNSHVFVFDGEVKVKDGSNERPRHVLSGRSLHFGAEPDSPDAEVARNDPVPRREGNWIPVTTADGAGRDTFIRQFYRGDEYGTAPLVMVKHTDFAPGNERRGLLAFDLARLGSDPVREVRLSLKIESSGLGFSSLVPDSRFAVYGLLDESAGDWDEEETRWHNAGLFAEDEIDPERFARLTEFTVPKGSPRALVDISSDALADFVDGRAGRVVTLMLVRETGEHDKQGLVHAFASREHPAGPPPTLWIETDKKTEKTP